MSHSRHQHPRWKMVTPSTPLHPRHPRLATPDQRHRRQHSPLQRQLQRNPTGYTSILDTTHNLQAPCHNPTTTSNEHQTTATPASVRGTWYENARPGRCAPTDTHPLTNQTFVDSTKAGTADAQIVTMDMITITQDAAGSADAGLHLPARTATHATQPGHPERCTSTC